MAAKTGVARVIHSCLSSLTTRISQCLGGSWSPLLGFVLCFILVKPQLVDSGFQLTDSTPG